jgi:uncharacterized protein YcbX
MLIDDQHNFITQRIYAQMAFFKLSFSDEQFTINFGNDLIHLPVNSPASTVPIAATIWNDVVEVYEVLGDYSRWFSQRLGINCRLVYFPEPNKRPVDEKFRIENDQVSLADAYPFLMIGQRSLDDLNSRLKNPVPMNRFRPNFVFTGGKPYEEDKLGKFTMGKNRFVAVKPCGRCVLTTVNQETAEKGTEPLATLTTYRRENNKVNFGQNLIAIDFYEVHEGDKIEYDV